MDIAFGLLTIATRKKSQYIYFGDYRFPWRKLCNGCFWG